MKKSLILLAIMAALLVLASCSGLKTQVKSPAVSLAGVRVVDLGFFEQRFAFKLRVQNPNDFDLPLTGLHFELEINGQPFAKGVNNKPVTVPRLGEEVIEVTGICTLSGILSQASDITVGQKGLKYRVKGRLASDSLGWLNIDESGEFRMPKFRQFDI